MVTVSFDYSQVPSYFVHCFNDRCPLAGKCLRRLAANQVTARQKVIQTINPAVWPAQETQAQCPHFLPMKPIRLAWGMRNALNLMPHQQAQGIIRALNRMYSRPTLHRIMVCQREIPPREQVQIEALFRRYEWTGEHPFDRIEWQYDFHG